MAVPFKNFNEALKALPKFLVDNIDLVGQHKTIFDLAFMVQHEIDLAVEGEPNDITRPERQSDQTKRWQQCKAFLARCKATQGAIAKGESSYREVKHY
jgi:hypothetical protein